MITLVDFIQCLLMCFFNEQQLKKRRKDEGINAPTTFLQDSTRSLYNRGWTILSEQRKVRRGRGASAIHKSLNFVLIEAYAVPHY